MAILEWKVEKVAGIVILIDIISILWLPFYMLYTSSTFPFSSNTNNAIQLDIASMVDVLSRQLLHESMQTRIASLRWIYHLHIKTPNKVSHKLGFRSVALVNHLPLPWKKIINFLWRTGKCDTGRSVCQWQKKFIVFGYRNIDCNYRLKDCFKLQITCIVSDFPLKKNRLQLSE